MQRHETTTETVALTGRLLRAQDICAMLGGIGRATLLRMAQCGQVPYYRVGQSGVRFDLTEVREALRRPARTEAAR